MGDELGGEHMKVTRMFPDHNMVIRALALSGTVGTGNNFLEELLLRKSKRHL